MLWHKKANCIRFTRDLHFLWIFYIAKISNNENVTNKHTEADSFLVKFSTVMLFAYTLTSIRGIYALINPEPPPCCVLL